MNIHFGCEFNLDCDQPTPVSFLLTVRPERRYRLRIADRVSILGSPTCESLIDGFGNIGTRSVIQPCQRLTVRTEGIIQDGALPDPVAPHARAAPISALPADILPYLLSSRYCEVDLLSHFAWQTFGSIEAGWNRVQAICDFVHNRVVFGYEHARPTRSAAETLREGVGVCRDYAHLAVALCRAVGIPARYATGYLGDIGVPPSAGAMDFSAWFEAWLDDKWYAFDARHNAPRIGRIPIAYGRDATDVAFVTTFGAHRLSEFRVWTDVADSPSVEDSTCRTSAYARRELSTDPVTVDA